MVRDPTGHGTWSKHIQSNEYGAEPWRPADALVEVSDPHWPSRSCLHEASPPLGPIVRCSVHVGLLHHLRIKTPWPELVWVSPWAFCTQKGFSKTQYSNTVLQALNLNYLAWDVPWDSAFSYKRSGDGVLLSGPWPHLSNKALMEFRKLLKSLFTDRDYVRVPAGNRCHTQIRIIFRGFNKRIVYAGQGKVRKPQRSYLRLAADR